MGVWVGGTDFLEAEVVGVLYVATAGMAFSGSEIVEGFACERSYICIEAIALVMKDTCNRMGKQIRYL